MTRKLEGRVALVTGGGKNIGRAIVLALADLGASVAVHGLTHPEAAEATARDAAARGVSTMAFTADVADYGQVQRMGQEVKDRLGPVEILVSNAAIRPGASLEELTPELWRRVMAVNLDAAFHLSKVFVPHMLEVGRGLDRHHRGAGGLWHQRRPRACRRVKSRADRLDQGPRHRIRRPQHPGQLRRPPARHRPSESIPNGTPGKTCPRRAI